MKGNHCIICKFKQIHSTKVREDLIYDAKGNAINLPLCYQHSVDLFKIGQISFIMKYSKALAESLSVDSNELVKYLPPKKRLHV